ncbi:hypothetical protein U27_04986 [Candidatus Vecturithrix granuli]|uniref:Uncharacterized protein n=1 Tax=Vecturithrix granuli TaxID=1499967 RepID=A0A081C0A8_VECG1|nr:hypothetical protein U27_04986 [Candidatus Vecturithrix granuli]
MVLHNAVTISEHLHKTYCERLIVLLSQDLDFFSNNNENHGTHALHSFPAKFPPLKM